MKKNLFVLLAVALLATSAFAAGGIVTGPPPSQQSYVTVQVIIPAFLGVDAESDLVYDLGLVSAQTSACETANVFPFYPTCAAANIYYTPTSGMTTNGNADVSFFSSDDFGHTVTATLTDATGTAVWNSAGNGNAPGNFVVSDSSDDLLGLGTGSRTPLNPTALAAVTLGNPSTNTFGWTHGDQFIEYRLNSGNGVTAGTYDGHIYFTISR